MPRTQEARPRARSPFAAAFLSLVFPGLGHLYAGATTRALAFAAAPVLGIALIAGVALRMDKTALIGLALNPTVWTSVFIVNILLVIYRLIAIVDAYRVAEFLNVHAAGGDGRLGPARLIRNPVSLGGLLAVILVMAGAHVVVARYDMLALDTLTSGCIFIDVQTTCADGSTDPDASASPDGSDGSDSQSPSATDTPGSSPTGTPVPDVTIPPWNGKDRLNILLLGADLAGGGHNTDTMITVSIDPVTKQVAMFSLPRDMSNLPVPAGAAQSLWGSTYQQKINSFYANNRNRSDIWPGTNKTRGYNALKSMIGNLYGIDIKYFVEVDFDGFKQVVDALGGVTVNVQNPIADDYYPAANYAHRRVFIPSGLQHMDGTTALRYARSRHGKPSLGQSSTDFDRSARQQRLLLSIREQADPAELIPRLPELIAALKASVKTDIPLDQLAPLLGLASQVDTANISSYVFQPPLYGSETSPGAPVYKMFASVSKIRAAVRNAFNIDGQDEALREKLAAEGASIYVMSGLTDRTVGPALAGYLEYRGLVASSPRAKPTDPVPAHTQIVVYNGAEQDLADTIAYLEKTFKTTVTLKTDPAVRADIVITMGQDTPQLEAPPLS